MNILITGANGFIGKHLVTELQKNHTVFQLCNSGIYDSADNIFKVNLLNEEHIDSFLKEEIKIDIIIHTASKLASTNNLKDISILKDNITMYEHLILIVNKFQPKKVINFSSIAVYPNLDGEYFENSEIRPSVNSEGIYGLSKFCGENLLDLYCNHIKVINLRVSQVYGEGMRSDRVYAIMHKELKENNTITVYGKGIRVSCFIDIKTLIEKILVLLAKDVSGIFNLCGENLSYKDLAQKIIKENGNEYSKIKLVDKGVSSKTFINGSKLKNIKL